MAETQQLQVQKKREQEKREESTIPARVFLPTADIYETQDALTVILKMPGVEKSNVNVRGSVRESTPSFIAASIFP
jgi:HSP20 family molecular chaperone IbpA